MWHPKHMKKSRLNKLRPDIVCEKDFYLSFMKTKSDCNASCWHLIVAKLNEKSLFCVTNLLPYFDMPSQVITVKFFCNWRWMERDDQDKVIISFLQFIGNFIFGENWNIFLGGSSAISKTFFSKQKFRIFYFTWSIRQKVTM